jgi:hypothetical protein
MDPEVGGPYLSFIPTIRELAAGQGLSGVIVGPKTGVKLLGMEEEVIIQRLLPSSSRVAWS